MPGAPAVLQRYLESNQELTAARSGAVREEAVEVEIEAALPRLRKHGTMRGVRMITRAGEIVYSRLRFAGDRMVGKDVISRYLAADVRKPPREKDFHLDPAHYRFESAGETDYNGRTADVFRVTPKRRRGGLFRGELWLDAATALPLRIWGDVVKSPSRFLSHPHFVRDYDLADGVAQPRRLILTARAAFVGDVEMTIWFTGGDGGDDSGESLPLAAPDSGPVASSHP